jgi:hypothetical protein
VPKFLRARPPQDDGEDRKVRRLAGARHAPADWSERARIVALSWDGLGVAEIAARIGCHENTVRRWLHRFNAAGIDGLGDRPGAGRKRRITEAQRSRIIALARSAPPGHLVGFQNSATGPGLGFYAARSYSLMRPPRTDRRWMRLRDRSATG